MISTITTTTTPSQIKNPQGQWHLPEIDGLRALAILLVYFYHIWEFSNSPSYLINLAGNNINLLYVPQNGAIGVDLFFVLSGFCLFLPVCKPSLQDWKNWNWLNFYKRRIRRIVPAYYAAIVYVIFLPLSLTLLLKLLHLSANWQPLPSAWQLFTHMLFIHTLFTETWSGINGSFWSLGPEAQFYLFFPLFVLGVRYLRYYFLLIMLVLSLSYRVVAGQLTAESDWTTQFLFSIFSIGRWLEFACGMAAAWIVASHLRSNKIRRGLLGYSLMAGAIPLCFIGVGDVINSYPLSLLPLRDLLLAIGFSMLTTGLCISITKLRLIFNNKLVVWIGTVSYSIFLIHQPTVYYLSELLKTRLKINPDLTFFFLCTFGLVIVGGISYLFHLIFEKPFLVKRVKPAGERLLGL